MRRAPHRLLSVSLSVSLLVVIVVGCASTIRLTRDPYPERLADLRAEYFAMNPESPYRDHVARGEIVKGMDAFGVLASWGTPERRARDENTAERWLYVDTDENSGDSVEYALSFRGGLLDSWRTLRHTGGSPAMRSSEANVATTPAEAPTGKRVPKE